MSEATKRAFFLLFLVAFFWGLYVYKFAPGAGGGGWGPKLFKKTRALVKDDNGRQLSAVAKAVMPAVVFVNTERTGLAHPFFNDGLKFKQESSGSGILISSDGTVATNGHVVAGAEKILVTLNDASEHPAKLLGLDSLSDVAVIKIEGRGLTAAAMGDSDSLEPGEWVIAIGSPMGLFNSVSFGIVSALGRVTAPGSDLYQDFIQTDAAINPGNSGGPLLNLNGEVVGMNTLIFSPTGGSVGLGFAIPANAVRFVVESLIKHGRVARGWLGVELQAVDRSLAEALGLENSSGALVAKVDSKSPAEKAGLAAGDVVVSFDGHPIQTYHDLRNRAGYSLPGKKAVLRVFRQGKEKNIKVVLGERKEAAEKPAP